MLFTLNSRSLVYGFVNTEYGLQVRESMHSCLALNNLVYLCRSYQCQLEFQGEYLYFTNDRTKKKFVGLLQSYRPFCNLCETGTIIQFVIVMKQVLISEGVN